MYKIALNRLKLLNNSFPRLKNAKDWGTLQEKDYE